MLPFHDDVPIQRVPLVVIAIIVMNATVFLWTRHLSPVQSEALDMQWGFVPARIEQLSNHQPIVVALPRGEPLMWPWGAPPAKLILQPDPTQIGLTLVTCLFLHGSWLHLIVNMWFLYIFGDNIEDRLGHVLFLFYYLAGGIAGSIAHWLSFPSNTMPVIGASGAIATILGAFAVTWPWARVRTLVFLLIFVTIVELPALLVLGIWFGIQVFSGAMQIERGAAQNVAWWAHVGGFVIGLVTMPLINFLMGAGRARVEQSNPFSSGNPE